MTSVHRGPAGVALLIVALCAASAVDAATEVGAPLPSSNSEWRLIGGGSFEQHFSPLHQVNDTTVKQLRLAWFADSHAAD
jgi:glucose dehydrogenase